MSSAAFLPLADGFFFASGIYQMLRDTRGLPVSHLFAMPAAPILDPSLIPGSKTLMAYLYAWAQSGMSDPPSREIMGKELHITQKTLTAYLTALRRSGYLKTEQQRIAERQYADFGLNHYWLLPGPSEEHPGQNGMTFVPRSLIRGSLTVKVKAFYMLFAALAGSQETLSVGKAKLQELAGISEVTYYKYLTQLKDAQLIRAAPPQTGRQSNSYDLFRLDAF